MAEGESRAAAVFDVDGTLVDSGYLHTLAWWEALRGFGHTVPMARIQRRIGMGTGMLLDAGAVAAYQDTTELLAELDESVLREPRRAS